MRVPSKDEKVVDKERTLSSMSMWYGRSNPLPVDRITHPYLVSVANAIRDSILNALITLTRLNQLLTTGKMMIVILTRRMVARERTRR
jgi:hypothetical protein